MELKSIRIFVLTAKYRNFSRVAETLFLSQSSISKYISALEADLGQQLLIRNTKSVMLTEFGRDFLPYAEKLLEQEENTLDFVHHYASGRVSNTIHMAVDSALMASPPDLLLFRLIRSVNQFYALEPGVHVKLKFYPEAEIRDMLGDQSVDLAVIVVNHGQISEHAYPDMNIALLDHCYNALLYPSLSGVYSTLEELLPHIDTLIYAGDPVPQSITSEFMLKCKISATLQPCENWSELFLNVLDGKGCGIVPETLLPLADECGIRYFKLQELNIVSSVCTVWNRAHQDDAVVKLSQVLRSQFSDCTSPDAMDI
jgi:DNA-binding transcriptional LysR family regulator